MNAPLQPDPWKIYYRVQELVALASHRQSPARGFGSGSGSGTDGGVVV